MGSITEQLFPACSPDFGSQYPSCWHGATLIQITTTDAVPLQPPLGQKELKGLSSASRKGCHLHSAKGWLLGK